MNIFNELMSEHSTVAQVIEEWSNKKNSHTSLNSYAHEIDVFSELTGVDQVDRMIDVGCGAGMFPLAAVDLGFAKRAVGIDPCHGPAGTEQEELEFTKEFLESAGIADRLELINGEFPDDMPNHEEFDLLCMRKALHHIYPEDPHEEVINGLEIAKASIEKGGHIHILESSIPPFPLRLAENTYRTVVQNKGSLDWENKRSANTWERLLSAAGFKNVRSKRRKVNLPYNGPAANQLAIIASRLHVITGTC